MPDSVLKSIPPPEEGAVDEEGLKELNTLKEQVKELARLAEFHKNDAVQAKTYVTALLAKMEETANASGNESKLSPEEEADRFLEAFKTNPTGAVTNLVEYHWRQRMGPILNEYNETQAQLQRAEAKRTLAEKYGQKRGKALWDKYEGELDQFMSGLSSESRSKPGAWLQGFQFVRAQHVDDEIKEYSSKSPEELEEEALLEGSSGSIGRKRSRPQLSDMEKKIAKEFEMSEADWIKNRAAYSRWDEEMK